MASKQTAEINGFERRDFNGLHHLQPPVPPNVGVQGAELFQEMSRDVMSGNDPSDCEDRVGSCVLVDIQ